MKQLTQRIGWKPWLAITILIASPVTSLALCAEPLDPSSALKAADAVFYGVARNVHYGPPKDPFGFGTVIVEMPVFAKWKGATQDTIFVETFDSSSMNGYPFEEGMMYLVYGTGRGDTVFTSHCDRTCADSEAYAEIKNLGKPFYDRRQGMDWKQLRDMWRAANGYPRVVKGETWKN